MDVSAVAALSAIAGPLGVPLSWVEAVRVSDLVGPFLWRPMPVGLESDRYFAHGNLTVGELGPASIDRLCMGPEVGGSHSACCSA